MFGTSVDFSKSENTGVWVTEYSKAVLNNALSYITWIYYLTLK